MNSKKPSSKSNGNLTFEKSNKPQNLLLQEHEIIERCKSIESQLPYFLDDFFLYLKSSVALTTRQAYLEDILFFFQYLVQHTQKVSADSPSEISTDEIKLITAKDVNRFIGDYCTHYIVEKETSQKIVENQNRSLSRKKSSLSVLFKFLYREELMDKNITDGFNPIKLPKPQPDAIKRLDIPEIQELLKLVEFGHLFTKKERTYWEKTKFRDKAIIVLFITYGLRISELQQLNLSSFNFSRGEFRIFRKRGKEVEMPLNQSARQVIEEYINLERPNSMELEKVHEDALFISLQNRRMTIKSIRNLIKKYTAHVLKTDSRKGYSPHKLRATAATSLIAKGFSIYDVQNLLDHDNITTTQLYAAHKKDVKRGIVSNFEWTATSDSKDPNSSESDEE